VASQWKDISAVLFSGDPGITAEELYGAKKVFYMGFYGALCTMNDREGPLNKDLNRMRLEIEDFMSKALEAELSLEDLKISEVVPN